MTYSNAIYTTIPGALSFFYTYQIENKGFECFYMLFLSQKEQKEIEQLQETNIKSEERIRMLNEILL